MMDVLKYWQPEIDWKKFKQGAVSQVMWENFCQVVQLCHSYQYWQRIASERRSAPLSLSAYPNESKYFLKKRRSEREAKIKEAEGHMYRAEFLTDDKVVRMSFLISDHHKGMPDWNLWWALRLTIRRQPHTRCRGAAFENFDADKELQGNPIEISNRWLLEAEYPVSELYDKPADELEI